MAENNKGGILNKAEKILRRRKTKVLQSLGKQGKTTDEILAEDCHKLDRQQEIATKFQKDLRHYIHSARALSAASKTFYATVAETYEPEWENHSEIAQILTNMEMLWQDYLQKLQEQVQEPITKYLANVPNIKARVAKRGRKLIDFDNAKHHLETMQSAKKKDDAKIAKAQEDLELAKKIYDDLNNELHQELPEFYNSRVSFYGNLFQSLFSAETVFHTEAGKGSETIRSSAEKLAYDHMHETYTPRANLRHTVVVGSDESLTNGHSENGAEGTCPDTPTSNPTSSQPTTPSSPVKPEALTNGTADADTSKESIEDKAEGSDHGSADDETNKTTDQEHYVNTPSASKTPVKDDTKAEISPKDEEKKEPEVIAEVTKKVEAAPRKSVQKKKEDEDTEKVRKPEDLDKNVQSAVTLVLKHDLTNQKLDEVESASHLAVLNKCNQSSDWSVNEHGYKATIRSEGNIAVPDKFSTSRSDLVNTQSTSVDTQSKIEGKEKSRPSLGRQHTHEEVIFETNPVTGLTNLLLKDRNDKYNVVGNVFYDTQQSNVDGEAKQSNLKEKMLDEKQEEVKVNGDLDTSKEDEVPEDAPPPVPASPPPDEEETADKNEEDDEDKVDGQDDGLYQVPPPAKPVADDLPAKYLYTENEKDTKNESVDDNLPPMDTKNESVDDNLPPKDTKNESVDDNLPPKYQYTVMATHAYKGEDDDELSFDAQEIIYVIQYDDPEEQDPGWLMGVRKLNRQTGVFPENFTKKV